jgi:hypothetical protein
MSLHKYTSVHYYEGEKKGLKGKPVLKPSSKESGYAGTYKKVIYTCALIFIKVLTL